jgi:hypothetical protein
MQQALSRSDAPLWVEAINHELSAIFEKGVYEECALPAGKRALSTKLVLTIKRDKWGNVDKYEARLVVRGFLQAKDIDYDEVFAPTAQSVSFRVLISIAAQNRLDMQQIDVSTAFLNGVLDEEVYVKLPSALPQSPGKVWKLKKALYGLKQAARVWNETITEKLVSLGFQTNDADPCLFIKGEHPSAVYVLIHVDDAVIVGQPQDVAEVKQQLGAIFDIKDLGSASYFLSIEITRSEDGIKLSQGQYVKKILEEFNMLDCKMKDTPAVVGSQLKKEGVS